MKRYMLALVGIALVGCGGGETSEPAPQRTETQGLMVFMGDSITARWGTETLVPGSVNKGIPGDTPCGMAARFDADVLALRPVTVHILGGANGIVDDHPTQYTCIIDMAQRAVAAGITTYVGTVTPGYDRPRAGVELFNSQLRMAAPALGFKIVDYYPAMFTGSVYFDQSLYLDTVHPNAAGYARMEAVFRSVVH